ncbi:MAG: hypothetical protein R2877_00740 [Bdellovibrionota bacterium]
MIASNSSRNKFRSFSILVSLVCALPCAAFGQAITTTNLSDAFFRAGSGLSMGGAYRAVADSPSAITYNPAGVAKERGKLKAMVDYAYQGETSSHLYGVGVVDYQTSPKLAYGLSFHRYAPTIAGVSGNVNQTVLSAGYSLGQMIQVGVSGKGYWINLDSPILQGPRGIDMDAGILIRPIPIISFGLTGYNLFQGQNREEFPTMLGLGTALLLDPHAKFTFDYVKNFNTPAPSSSNYALGAEIRVADSSYLRGGFNFDGVANNNYYSVGAALVGPTADLMFTFSQRMSPSYETYAVSAAFKF